MVVTLNLIGAPGHIYMSHYDSTFALHNQIADVEAKLKRRGQLTECHQLFHKLKDHDSDYEDDHYPLINEGSYVYKLIYLSCCFNVCVSLSRRGSIAHSATYFST